MWFLNFIPQGFLQLCIHALVIAGIACYILGTFGRVLRPIEEYAVMIKALGSILFVVGVFFEGGYATDMSWRYKMAEAEKETARLTQAIKDSENKSKDNNVQIKTVYVNRIKTVHDVQVKVQTQIVHDAAKMDAECKVDPLAIKDLNEAAK